VSSCASASKSLALEVPEIVTRTVRSGGPVALLFEKTKGKQSRVLVNQFGHRTGACACARASSGSRAATKLADVTRSASRAGPRREDARAETVEVDRDPPHAAPVRKGVTCQKACQGDEVDGTTTGV